MKKSYAIVSAYLDMVVPFYDVDPMRIVWHGNYVKYIEDARCVLLDKIGYNYIAMEESGYMWPIVDMRLKYVASAKFGSHIRIHADLMEFETRIKIDYRIECLDTNKILNKAYTIQVAVDIETQELQFESPAALTDKVLTYVG
ncbi:thioesterase [Pseudoalteromonas porphyrae]|uniref:acyl-CoA thioesterase n=1 Tax=Pseudoalteromonas TaxID=53246 RepID=UPI0006BAD187|nr:MULTISPECIES: acyl-CoA thioesterase [Pseudoalteromonas]KPH95941.1 thioesterase [Pseudoalteromonas porphyrae]NMR25653.1 acyl-CoA thioesterase [Pseudoalteromonas sp. NEC-BIFX-2020_015]NNG41426.1 acyl-CoA thioesterase [Pseudoalteromonas sp. NEC-BIFX-2020_002]